MTGKKLNTVPLEGSNLAHARRVIELKDETINELNMQIERMREEFNDLYVEKLAQKDRLKGYAESLARRVVRLEDENKDLENDLQNIVQTFVVPSLIALVDRLMIEIEEAGDSDPIEYTPA